MIQYFVYILYSLKLDRYYIGSTKNIEERVRKHNHIHKGFTGTGQPWTLVYCEEWDSMSSALKREKQIKSWKSRDRIIKLIREASETGA